jgi:hypothetical protein
VGLAAGEVDVEVGDGQAGALRRSVGQGWTIMAAWTPVEGAALEHEDLAAAALLGRGAEDRTVSPRSSATEARASPAPTAWRR